MGLIFMSEEERQAERARREAERRQPKVERTGGENYVTPDRKRDER